MLTLPDFMEKQLIVLTLYEKEKLSFKNDNLVLVKEDGEIKYQISCYKIFSVFISGHLSITSGLLERAKRFGFSIAWYSYSFRQYGGWNFKTEGNFLLREKQYLYKDLDIAKHLVKNKILNQKNVLNHFRNKDVEIKEIIQKLDELIGQLAQENLNLQNILGIEGNASRLYFKRLFDKYEWKARRPRVKHDIINLLLDLGYTLLFHFIEGLLNLYGFDLYKGVYHQNFYQRKSLVCDIVEPFRCIIDFTLLKAFNLNQIKTGDFKLDKHKYYLLVSGPYKKIFIESLIEQRQEIFKFVQQYYRNFIQEKSIENYPLFYYLKPS